MIDVQEGDIVHFKKGAVYVPNGKKVPRWIKIGWGHVVTKTLRHSEPMVRDGERLVFLGKKVRDGTTEHVSGIMAWVAISSLEKSPEKKGEILG